MVVNLILTPTQPQNNLEIVSPIDDPTSSAWNGSDSTMPSGSGTIDDPYIIATPANLNYIRNLNNGKYFKQTANLDMGNQPFTPIPHSTYYYNGNGFYISNLKISTSASRVRLFANIENSYIKNLGIMSGSIEYTGSDTGYHEVGSFVGMTYGTTTITNCYNKASVSGVNGVGGLVGAGAGNMTSLKIENSYNDGTVNGSNDIGGIVGASYNAAASLFITNCYNLKTITGAQNVGGIGGLLRGNVFLNNCTNSGQITGSNMRIGGICGGVNGVVKVNNCYNTANIATTIDRVAGIVGEATGASFEIMNSYNTGVITCGDVVVGGIVGLLLTVGFSDIKNCYNTGLIKGLKDVSGIVGDISNSSQLNKYITNISYCYNLGSIESTATSGNSNASGIVGLIEFYGADVSISHCFNGGNISGSRGAVGGIVGREDSNSNRLHVKNCYNTGSVTARSECGGLVGWFEGGNDSICEIVDCYNTGNIKSTVSGAGGIFGSFSGNATIMRCFNTGIISGVSHGGGIGSYCRGVTIVDNCYNTGAVSVTNGYVGGIVGYCNEGMWSNLSSLLIKNCYNASSVTSTNTSNYIGGILGTQNRKTSVSIICCHYSTNFYAGNLTGTPENTSEQILYTSGSSGLTTDQMKSASDGSPSTNFNSSHWTATNWNFVAGALPTIKKTLALPEVLQTFVYDGTAKTLMVCGFDTNYMTISGNTATNAGTYTCTLTLKNASTSIWEDGTTAAKTLTWTIDRATIDESLLPTQSGNLNYTGNSQNVSWSVFDSSKITAGGTTSATNAGTYKATFTPTANYKWADGTTEGKTVEWTINKQTLTNPSLDLQNNETTFTGTTQDITNVLQNFDSTKMTIEGNTQAIRAGTYVFVVSLKPEYQNNYIFANGQNFVVIAWTILPYNIENATVSVGGN